MMEICGTGGVSAGQKGPQLGVGVVGEREQGRVVVDRGRTEGM